MGTSSGSLPKEHTSVEIIWEYKGMGVLIEAYVETENGTGHVIVANAMTGLCFWRPMARSPAKG